MNNFLRSFENFDNVFDPKTRSEELFGFGKKKNDKNKEPEPKKLTKEEGFEMFKIGIKVYKEVCTKCGNPKGFKPYNIKNFAEAIEDNDDDDYNSADIGRWDAWEFTDGHPRDEEEGKKFDKMLIDVMNQCNKLLEERKLPYGVDCKGDVEDGKLYIFLGHKEQQKSYMV